MLTKTEWAWLVRMLRDLNIQYGYAGCNEMQMSSNEGNLEMMQDISSTLSEEFKESCFHVEEEDPATIYTQDLTILSHLENKVWEMSGLTKEDYQRIVGD